MIRAVIYARYSSDLQREASIEDQVRVCRVRADREGWSVVETFSDHAMSGSTLLRPGYQALLAHLRASSADIVVAESLDRFSRDQEHIAAFFKQVTFARARIFTLAEGEVSELHIGLKGTMGALYLKDLAAKTHRGIEGRVREGCSASKPPYGYRLVRRLKQDGELERGLREIDEVKAVIVRRIFDEYTAGKSPRSIAQGLNREGVAGPSGGTWYDSVIRGHGTRMEGLLRNPVYRGQLVWNRVYNTTDPITGARVRRPRAPSDLVVLEKPDLAIVDVEVWSRVQERLLAEAAPAPPGPDGRPATQISSRRRPRHLLSGKVICGVCGTRFAAAGKDYLACPKGLVHACSNGVRPRRPPLEDRVLGALGSQLMKPDLVDAFAEEFSATWDKLAAAVAGDGTRHQREMAGIEKKIGHLVDAIADGLSTPDLGHRLSALERRRAELASLIGAAPALKPLIPSNLAAIYQHKVQHLRDALKGPSNTEALEAARGLVDRVIVSPADSPDDPPHIELVGDLASLLGIGGFKHQGQTAAGSFDFQAFGDGSVLNGFRAEPLPSFF